MSNETAFEDESRWSICSSCSVTGRFEGVTRKDFLCPICKKPLVLVVSEVTSKDPVGIFDELYRLAALYA